MDNKQCYRQLHQVVTDLRDEYTPKMVRATTDYSRVYTHPPRKKILGVFPTRKTGVNTRAEEEKSTCILLYRNAKNAFIRDMRHAVEDLCGDVSREVGRDIVEASCVFGYCMIMDGGYCEAQRNGLTIPFDGLEYIHLNKIARNPRPL